MSNLTDAKLKWERLLAKPDWYLTIVPEIEAIRKSFADKSKFERDSAKEELYDFFELHLKNADIALEKEPPKTDVERKAIDAIVVHHTSNPSGMSKERLSAIELIRLYAPHFYEKKDLMKGMPIYSGHARNGQQVFWPYHWFVHKNGEVERLLEDGEIG